MRHRRVTMDHRVRPGGDELRETPLPTHGEKGIAFARPVIMDSGLAANGQSRFHARHALLPEVAGPVTSLRKSGMTRRMRSKAMQQKNAVKPPWYRRRTTPRRRWRSSLRRL